jgi:hypothetical protein
MDPEPCKVKENMVDLRRAEGALFVPEDAAQTRFVGFVRVGEDEFKVRVSGVRYAVSEATIKHTARPPRMLLDAARVDAERPLAALLAPHEALLKVRDTIRVRAVGEDTDCSGFCLYCRCASGRRRRSMGLSENYKSSLP